MRARAGVIGLVAAGIVSAASAQPRPSFDCAKATTAIEKALCSDTEAADADRKMAEAWRRLSESLSNPAARAHLQRDQAAWLVDRQRICTAQSAQSTAGRKVPMCLRDLAAARAERLATLPAGDAYPFVGERRIVEQGRRGGMPYEIAVSFAVFEAPSVDYARANASIKAWVDKFATSARPPTQPMPGAPGIGWFLESGHIVLVASRELVTVAAHWTMYSGGAHPNNGRLAWHVASTTGRELGLDDVFNRASGWREAVLALARADLKKQFEERPGFEESLEPATLGKLLAEPRRWIFTHDKVILTFDPYEVGPYAAGPYEVELSYAALSPYIRKDGPLAARGR